jgi:hypothetical protein
MSEDVQTQPKVSLSAPPPPPAGSPQPGESGYVPPTALVPLPSKGKIYPTDSPLYGLETVEIRSMTAREEDILSSRALLRAGKAVDALIQACLCNKTLKVDEMLEGDRNAILIAIRITGYGPDYEVTVPCPACEKKISNSFDLSKLEIKPLGEEPEQAGVNAFKVELPVSKKTAVFKLLTGADEKDMAQAEKQLKKALGVGAPETPVTSRLFYHTLSIGGETDRNKLKQIISTLPAGDSHKLRSRLEQVAPGVDMSQTVTCPECSEEVEVVVPVGPEFFWPDAG